MRSSSSSKFLPQAYQVLLARGGPGVGRVRPQLRVPAWLVWRVEVSVRSEVRSSWYHCHLRSDSSLAVGLATRLGDPTQSVLAPHRWHHGDMSVSALYLSGSTVTRSWLSSVWRLPPRGADTGPTGRGDLLILSRSCSPWVNTITLCQIKTEISSTERFSLSWCSVDQSAGITCSQNIRNIKNKLLCRSFLSNLVQMLNFY